MWKKIRIEKLSGANIWCQRLLRIVSVLYAINTEMNILTRKSVELSMYFTFEPYYCRGNCLEKMKFIVLLALSVFGSDKNETLARTSKKKTEDLSLCREFIYPKHYNYNYFLPKIKGRLTFVGWLASFQCFH